MQLSDDGSGIVGNKIKLDCDCLGVSGGWTPMVHLFTQSGGKLVFREIDSIFYPGKAQSEQISVGSCNGDFELDVVVNNTNIKTKEFLKIDNSEFDNLDFECSKEKDKKKYMATTI